MNILEFTKSQNLSLSLLFVAVYLIALLFCRHRALVYATLASVAAQVYGLLTVFIYETITDKSLTFLVYAAIYFNLVIALSSIKDKDLTSYKIMITSFIMGIFCILTYKAYLDAIGNREFEAFIYNNYENIAAILHVCIVFSVVRWARVINFCRGYSNNILLNIWRHSLTLPFRG